MGVFDSVIPIRKRCSGVFYLHGLGPDPGTVSGGGPERPFGGGAAAGGGWGGGQLCADDGLHAQRFFGVDDLGGGWVGPSGYL